MPSLVQDCRDVRFVEGVACPRPDCGSKIVIRFGRQKNGVQRYFCKGCRRTFNDQTGTLFARTKLASRWEGFARCMKEAYSCHKTGEELHVHYTTAFRWRHKALAEMLDKPQETITGIVEADEDSFLRSQKGLGKVTDREPRKRGGRRNNRRPRGQGKAYVFLMVARSRERKTASFVLDRVTKKAVTESFEPVVQASTLCTDGSKALTAYAKNHHLEHYVLHDKPGERVKGLYHIQNVNSYHSRFDRFIYFNFYEVSTKYLNRYARWHLFVEDAKRWDNEATVAALFGGARLPQTCSENRCPNCGAILPMANVTCLQEANSPPELIGVAR